MEGRAADIIYLDLSKAFGYSLPLYPGSQTKDMWTGWVNCKIGGKLAKPSVAQEQSRGTQEEQQSNTDKQHHMTQLHIASHGIKINQSQTFCLVAITLKISYSSFIHVKRMMYRIPIINIAWTDMWGGSVLALSLGLDCANVPLELFRVTINLDSIIKPSTLLV